MKFIDIQLTRRLMSQLGFGLCALLVLSSFIAGNAYATQLSYRSGQHIEPAYEGWRQNSDGTYSFIFGYFNENWEQELDIPVGKNNQFSPGDADRGQPTHFLPRRNRFTFEVVVPSDWGDRELVWTLTSPNGESRKAYATLAKDYVIDNVVIASETGSLGAGTSSPESRANKPPSITLLGETSRKIKVGKPLFIQARLKDDGVPKADDPLRFARNGKDKEAIEKSYRATLLRPPTRIFVNKVNGLYLSWNHFRGPGEVTFDPPQSKVWEDTRPGSNSPWGALWVPPEIPDNGEVTVQVTFSKPGNYVLWGRADDGGLYSDQFIEVTVTP